MSGTCPASSADARAEPSPRFDARAGADQFIQLRTGIKYAIRATAFCLACQNIKPRSRALIARCSSRTGPSWTPATRNTALTGGIWAISASARRALRSPNHLQQFLRIIEPLFELVLIVAQRRD